jgi:E3 ubiquitin-protein ligase RNF5
MLADELEFGFSHAHLGLVARMDRPSSSTASSSFRPESAERPRRLICLTGGSLTGRQSRYFRSRRFRSDLPPLSSEAPSLEDDAGAEPVEPEEPVRATMEENKVIAGVATVGVLEDEATERGKSSAMFECNICFEMAAEPVVTSCGHLFCWPCLYQWLHVHSSHKECPVCKGEVTSGNITPIYARGDSCSDTEKKVAEDGNASGPKIPPRPHGNRLESFRQQCHHLRPISRRHGDAHGIFSTWRRILDQHLVNSMSRPETPESIAQENRFSRMTTRLRARRLLREVEIPTIIDSSASESGPPMSNTFDPLPSSPFSSEGIDILRQVAFSGLDDSERLTTALGDLRRTTRRSQFGASTSSNPPNAEPVAGTNVAMPLAADQASNSSTMAVIQEDAAFTESAGEPSNAGSSRSLRSRRIDTLASLDVNGGDLHRNKRRRLN